MSHLAALKACTRLDEIAHLLGYKPKSLSYLLYVQPERDKYRSFEIRKKSGGTRTINAPNKHLKLLQRRLSNLLNNCLDEIDICEVGTVPSRRVGRLAHGFVRHRSILTNAEKHRSRRYVFNVDLNDFFGSINFGRVRGYFIKDRAFALDPRVATILAQIACHNNCLPQGSPSSPVISNLIGHVLDVHLVGHAARTGCTYSRYADDLSFSTNKPNFPSSIAVCQEDSGNSWLPGVELERLVSKSGFQINRQKVHMQYRNSRQEVTGLVVNRKPNIKRDYRRNTRAMVDRLVKKGEFYVDQAISSDENEARNAPAIGTAEQLNGRLAFVNWIDLYNSRVAGRDGGEKRIGKEVDYERFLLYREFYAASRPTVLCEGKTDTVYITHAIRKMAGEYPSLAAVRDDGGIDILLRRFRYSNATTCRVLGLHGGAGELQKFIKKYKEAAERFLAEGMTHPIILVLDNDGEGKGILKAARKAAEFNADNETGFLRVTRNLYVVLVPQVGDKEDANIEDCFDDKTLDMEVDGKKFNRSNKSNHGVGYGKAIFAYRVVEKMAGEIDFSGFRPLLDRIVGVLEHHGKVVESEYASVAP